MIKHIVMWNVSGQGLKQKNEAAQVIKAKFESLMGRVPGLIKIEIGIDISRASYACDVVLYSEFRDTNSLAAYAEHPLHLQIRDELQGMRIARYQVDYLPEALSAEAALSA